MLAVSFLHKRLRPCSAGPGQLPDPLHQGRKIGRLDQDGVGRRELIPAQVAGIRRVDDDGYGGVVLQDPMEQLHPIHAAGQPRVQHHQIDLPGLDAGQALIAVGGDQRIEPGPAQFLLVEDLQGRPAVDEQDGPAIAEIAGSLAPSGHEFRLGGAR